MHTSPMMHALEPRVLCYAGDVLVAARSGGGLTHVLRRYNQAGDLLAEINIPGGAHDFQVDRFGQVQMWIDDRLYARVGGFSPVGRWVPEAKPPGWSTIGRTFYGGLATLGQYVFGTDQAVANDDTRGLIRFDANNGYAGVRFATDRDLSDVSVGNNGLLYAMSGGQTTSPQVHVYDPDTLALVRTLDTPGFDNSSVVADADGNIYLAGIFENTIWKLSPTGTVMKSVNVAATDMDIAADGTILLSGGGILRLLDPELNEITSFEAGSFTGTTFVAFAEHQHPLGLTATLLGRAFHDFDNDGNVDAGEPPLRGRRVWIDLNNNGVHDGGDRSAATNASGIYQFERLPAGTYPVHQILPEGWTPTKPFARHVVTLAGGQTLGGQNFGSRQNAVIRGFVYHDYNRNGVREDVEPPLSQWQLFLDLDADGVLDPGEVSVRSNNRGQYTFANLLPGTYTIRIVQQPGWFRTSKPAFELTLGSGEVAVDRLFGEKRIMS